MDGLYGEKETAGFKRERGETKEKGMSRRRERERERLTKRNEKDLKKY